MSLDAKNNKMPAAICIVGGGAAAIFASIFVAQAASTRQIIVLEKSKQFLTKVRISGGGRCNVTHACFDPKILVQNYPRGGQALLGPFSRFQPRDTMAWFEAQGVALKIEEDGRVFPTSDDSLTIVNALLSAAHTQGVELRTHASVVNITKESADFMLTLADGEKIACQRLLLATGSNPHMWEIIRTLGHHIVAAVPSLFTFNTPANPLLELAGVSVPDAHVKIKGLSLQQRGPILITHWGFSGPAILKLSAWGARLLHEKNYAVDLQINWLPAYTAESLRQEIIQAKGKYAARLLWNESPVPLPRNLWKKLAERAGISAECRWAQVSNVHVHNLLAELHTSTFAVQGKSTYKDEFVTCGGVERAEIDFKSMQSKICPHLYFAGEIIDIDGVTGGFNFQNAWTTAWIAAQAMINSFE